jgi:hypothetical protein
VSDGVVHVSRRVAEAGRNDACRESGAIN